MCILCSGNAQFILRYDKAHSFYLAAMQGEVGAALFARHSVDPTDPDTIIVVEGDQVWRNSDAVLRIYSGLGWPWQIMSIFKVVPLWLRDPIYRLIATNRYRIFGKRETCRIPTPEQRARVLG